MKNVILLFVMMLLPIGVNADDSGTCGENLTWTYVEATQTLTISGNGEMDNYYYYQNATKKHPWDDYNLEMETLVIESGVKSIGEYAFYRCTKLKKVYIPSSITTIGNNAFGGPTTTLDNVSDVYITDLESWCNITFHGIVGESWHLYLNEEEVKNLVIPSYISEVKALAFEYCCSINSVTFHDELLSINMYAFGKCVELSSISIPYSVTSIGDGAFRDCINLISVSLSNSLTKIESCAFQGCSSLSTIIIPDGITTLAAGTFSGCSNLISVSLPSSLTIIEEGAFRDCSSLITINLPSGITSIGSNAFSGCRSLLSITIPNNVTIIEYGTFQDCI